MKIVRFFLYLHIKRGRSFYFLYTFSSGVYLKPLNIGLDLNELLTGLIDALQ